MTAMSYMEPMVNETFADPNLNGAKYAYNSLTGDTKHIIPLATDWVVNRSRNGNEEFFYSASQDKMLWASWLPLKLCT